MPRVLFLFPTTTYRAEAFLSAARRMGLEAAVASEEPSSVAALNPAGLVDLDFGDPERAAAQLVVFAERWPVDAIIPVDERTVLLASLLSRSLGLRHNPPEAAAAAADKFRMREALRAGGVPTPDYRLVGIAEDPVRLAGSIEYPCVLKPRHLSGSRGVIRADDPVSFAGAFLRVSGIVRDAEASAGSECSRTMLIEQFVSGPEVAVEGLLEQGRLRLLAIFDKPDPMDGPFFEETLYLTPSALPDNAQAALANCTLAAAKALGLREGPIHAELRLQGSGTVLIEIAARSIGGRCSAALRFEGGVALEEVILAHALGRNSSGLARESQASGVMMIPVPQRGRLKAIRGVEDAARVGGIESLDITAHPGQELIPLPEQSRYMGFIFSRAASAREVEGALREARAKVEFVF